MTLDVTTAIDAASNAELWQRISADRLARSAARIAPACRGPSTCAGCKPGSGGPASGFSTIHRPSSCSSRPADQSPGAAGYQRHEKRDYTILAGAVVLASGGCAFLSRALGTNVNTGDDAPMAAEVSADSSGIAWVDAGAADGFNIMPPYLPGGLDDFVDQVVPILQARGRFRTEYTEKTLRGHYGLDVPSASESRATTSA